MDAINVVYMKLLPESLAQGGSPESAGQDVDHETDFSERLDLVMMGRQQAPAAVGDDSAVDAQRMAQLEAQLEAAEAEKQRLQEVHAVLVANVKNTRIALKRYKDMAAEINAGQ